ncbi:MAG: ParB N-terminal domain-containing protein [Nitrosopumilales archaeon]|nr:ParB N-terminal domain-containing protein [Nitrosopumilales archaeon]
MSLCKVKKFYDGPIDVALKNLILDQHNVRFKHLPQLMSDRQIEEWLLDEQDVRQLIKQILRIGYLEQPIFVKKQDGKYIVKEGNRRTVALREITRQIITGKIKNFEKGHFDIVTVMVLNGTEKEIDLFLGTAHVSGPKEWAAANKAGHIFDLIEKHNETYESVAEYLAMTKREVMNYYFASKAAQTYGKRYPQDKNYLHKFSFFGELYNSRVLREWLEEDPSNLDHFIDMVAGKKFSVTYRDVRKFAKIIAMQEPKCSQALAILNKEDGNIEKAYDFVCETLTSKTNSWKKIENIHKTLKEMTYEEYSEEISDPKKQFLLEDLSRLVTTMKENVSRLKTGAVSS